MSEIKYFDIRLRHATVIIHLGPDM